jgi:RNase H-like domain found in reverse transcriptase/Reverse transcriptase (RNA-dependent DNA polymerase)/Integrase zinc binding domain/Chromo (CHRromatin Organisation MOdifier) domain
MDKIKGAKFFTKFDVRWGYNNVRIKAKDQWKAAFKTNWGLFEPMVMFFGMCNSPATFQAMMDSIFSDMIEEQRVIVYMDNILIFAENQEELQEWTKQVLQRLQEHDLFLKPKKCKFNKTTMEYLGLIIQEGKLSMDPIKVSGIRDWPIPTTVKQVWEFIGFANFYRQFIKKFSRLILPLNNLLRKDTKFDWNDQCQEAFETLKGRFLQEPILMMPDHSKPFQMESDASKYASGAVLTQTDINGDRHPVAFLSKTFTDTERRYKIYDRELLEIVWALKEWRHYIQGSGHTTLIHMDHRNLTYFRKAQKLSDWQARWSLFLSKFDIKLQHLPGNKIILLDALSRRPDHCPEEDETKEEILLPDDLFLNLLDVNLRDRITKNKEYDFNVTRAIELLQEEGPTSIQNNLEDWKIEEVDDQKTIFYKGKQYVPKDQELWRDILKLFHDHKTAGHPGELETYNSVKQHYWWPGLRIFVKNYVKGCGICQQFKIDQNPSHPSFIPVEGAISTRPFVHCSIDLITDLPPAEGSDSILVMVDQGLLKRVILCPTTKTVTMDGIGDLLHENLYKRFGLPDKMLSDRGPQFAAKAFRAMLSRLRVNSVLSTAYHPQMDGTTECVNQEIEAYLAIYYYSHPETWKKNLAILEFTHNNQRHADWPKTSFEIIQGESPKALPLTCENTKFPSIDDKIKQMMTNRDEALAAHELARARMIERRWNTFTPFTIGQKVWFDTRNMKMNYHKKMALKQEGPFKVEEVLGPVTYQLKLPTTWKVHNIFHAVLLKPYIEMEVHGENFPRPILDILYGEEVYNVETILKHRKRGQSYQYLIKWEGYPISEASWEPETAFSDDGDLLSTYKQRHQLWDT